MEIVTISVGNRRGAASRQSTALDATSMAFPTDSPVDLHQVYRSVVRCRNLNGRCTRSALSNDGKFEHVLGRCFFDPPRDPTISYKSSRELAGL